MSSSQFPTCRARVEGVIFHAKAYVACSCVQLATYVRARNRHVVASHTWSVYVRNAHADVRHASLVGRLWIALARKHDTVCRILARYLGDIIPCGL